MYGSVWGNDTAIYKPDKDNLSGLSGRYGALLTRIKKNMPGVATDKPDENNPSDLSGRYRGLADQKQKNIPREATRQTRRK